MLCLLAKFYNSEDQSLTTRQFVPIEELEETVTRHVDRILESEPEEELKLNLSSVAQIWHELPKIDEKKNLRRVKNNRISFILRVLDFLENEGLVQVFEDHEIRLLPKMEHLVVKYYFHSECKEHLLKILDKSLPLESGIIR